MRLGHLTRKIQDSVEQSTVPQLVISGLLGAMLLSAGITTVLSEILFGSPVAHYYPITGAVGAALVSSVILPVLASLVTRIHKAKELLHQAEELRRAYDAVRESEEKFKYVFDYSLIGKVLERFDGVVYTNKALREMLGRSAEELDKISWREITHPADLDVIERARVQILSGEKQSKRFAIRFIHKNGPMVWADVSTILRRDAEGKPWYLMTSVLDITELKHAEAALREFADRLVLATRAGAVGIWDYDVADNRLVWDEQMFRLYGVTKNQFKDGYEEWQRSVHPDDRARTSGEILSALAGEKDFDTEFRVVWTDGSIHSIRALALVQRDDSGRPLHMVGTNWDITVQKQAAHELREINLKLEQATANAKMLAQKAHEANAAKSRFLASMSHEIRTPMNGVVGMVELLLKTELNEEQQEYAMVAQNSGRTLLALIDEILDFSKIEAGKIILENLDFSLRESIEEVVRLLRVQAESKGLCINVHIAPAIPNLIRGDARRLKQVVINLCANAIKFTEQGEVTLSVAPDAASQSVPKYGQVLRFSVNDTGIGIPQDQVGGLFTPFTQADTSMTRKYGGTGLGLAISKQLVGMMGGRIGVESREGHGSTFWFTAAFEPARLSTEPAGKPKSSRVGEPQAEVPAGRIGRILVTEDNATNRVVVLAQLQKLGYKADAVVNGAEAVEAVHSGLYDLVLMDCQMPVMDGFEATRRIRQSAHRDIAIIALTASAMMADRQQCLAAGMNDHLSKPVNIARLNQALTTWLAGSKDAGTGKNSNYACSRCEEAVTDAFDENLLLERLMGDEELAGQIVRRFVQDFPTQLENLRRHVGEGDAAKARLQAHAIKGAAANISAESLRAVAESTEHAAAAGLLDRCNACVPRMSDEFERFRNALDSTSWL